jgi:hypothetical protein
LIADADNDIRGFHVFTFNQVESTQRWRRELAESLVRGREGLGPDAERDTAS